MDVFLFWILWLLATLAAQILDHFVFRGLGFAAVLLAWVQGCFGSESAASLGIAFISAGSLGLIDGAVMGLFQWAALRQRVRVTGWWIFCTVMGTGIGMGLFYAILGVMTPGLLADEILVDQVLWLGIMDRAVVGLVVGLAQWLVLRKRMPAALGWIPWLMLVMAGAWVARFYLNLAAAFLGFSALTGLFFVLFPPTSEVEPPTSEVV